MGEKKIHISEDCQELVIVSQPYFQVGVGKDKWVIDGNNSGSLCGGETAEVRVSKPRAPPDWPWWAPVGGHTCRQWKEVGKTRSRQPAHASVYDTKIHIKLVKLDDFFFVFAFKASLLTDTSLQFMIYQICRILNKQPACSFICSGRSIVLFTAKLTAFSTL